MEDNYRITDEGIEDLRYEIVEDHNDDWNDFIETVLAQHELSAEDRAIFDRFIIEIETVPPIIFSLTLNEAYTYYFNWCLGLNNYGEFSHLFLENWTAKRYKTYMIKLSDEDPNYAIRVLALQKSKITIDHPFYSATCAALDYAVTIKGVVAQPTRKKHESNDNLLRSAEDVIKPAAKESFYRLFEVCGLKNGDKKEVTIGMKVFKQRGYFIEGARLNQIFCLANTLTGLSFTEADMRKYSLKHFNDWMEDRPDIPPIL